MIHVGSDCILLYVLTPFNMVMKFLFIQYNTSISSNLLVSSINSFILLQNPFLINSILVIFIFIIIILSNKIP